MHDAGFRVDEHPTEDRWGPPPEDWQRRADLVDEEIAKAHDTDPRWQLARDRSEQISALLEHGHIIGTLMTAFRR